ncbi:unnamed protein product, partial [Mesorhabditis spiculigera]
MALFVILLASLVTIVTTVSTAAITTNGEVAAALYIVGLAETVVDFLRDHNWSVFDETNEVRVIGIATCIILMAIICIGISIESKLQQSFFTIFSIYFPAATGIMAGANISGDLKNPQMAIPRGTLLAIVSATLIYMGTVLVSGSVWVRDADGVTRNWVVDGNILKPNCTGSCQYGLMNDYQVMSEISAWPPMILIGILASTLSSALASLVSAPKIFQAMAADNLFPYITWFKKGYGADNAPRRAYALTFAITVGMILIGKLDLIAPIISNFFLCTYTLVNYACFDASYSNSPGFRPAFRFYSMWLSLLGSVVCIAIMFVMSWPTALATFMAFAAIFVFLKKNKPEVNWGSSTQANHYKSTLAGLQRMDKYDEHVKNYRPQILLMTGEPSARPGLVDFAGSITRGASLLACANVITHAPSHRLSALTQRSDSRAKLWLRERGIKSFAVTISANNLHEATNQLAQSYGIGKLVPNIFFYGFKTNWAKGGAEKLDECCHYVSAIQAAFDHHMSVAVLRNRMEGFDMLDRGNRDAMKRASEQWPRGTPPRGRPSLNPVMHQELFRDRARRAVGQMGKRFSKIYTSEKANSMPSFEPPQNKQLSVPDMAINGVHKLSGASGAGLQLPSPFCVRIKKARIDVWWLSDDGGLTLLLPHLLTLERSYLEDAELRVFTVGSQKNPVMDSDKLDLAALLNKFRINFVDVETVVGIEQKPHAKTLETWETLITPYRAVGQRQKEGEITEHDLTMHKGKTYRHLRCGELLQKYSEDADLIVVTLPVPSKGTPAPLYLSWLEMMSRGLPPTLLVRGNHSSVLTFYS